MNNTNSMKDSIRICGRFDAHEIATFREQIAAVRAVGSNVHVDLHEVTFIDSIALAELVKLHKELSDAGGKLTLCSPSDPVRVILEVTGLLSVFHVVLGSA